MWATAVGKLAHFDQITAHSPFLGGDDPVYADFLLFGILGNLTYNGWNPFPPLENLRAWHTRLERFSF